MNYAGRRPFFIVGHPRSGTTLMRMILCGHSKIFIPEETGFLPFLNINAEKQLTIKDIDYILRRIGKLNYLWRNIPLTASQIYQDLSSPRLSELLDYLYMNQIQGYNAIRWGDKTPLYVQYMKHILTIFPAAQFIHIIRDGRDAASSARKKWGNKSFYMDLTYLMRNWVRNVKTGRGIGSNLKDDQYFEIRYEDLVTSPEEITRQVCSFLDETFEPVMLTHVEIARLLGPGPDNHMEILNPINNLSIGRWRTEFSAFEKKTSHYIAGPLLTELGYENHFSEPMTNGELIRFGLATTKFIVFDICRTILYKTGIFTLNMNMRNQSNQPR